MNGGGVGYSVLYRDNEDWGVTSGCQAEGCGKHPGVDIRTPSGSNVYAAFAGTVTISEDYNSCSTSGWGGLIVIQSSNPWDSGYIFTAFAHLKARYVTSGWVDEGTVIGLSGGASGDYCHGNSTGAHLHFQVGKDSGYPWFPSSGTLNDPDDDEEVLDHTYHPIAMVQGFNFYSTNNSPLNESNPYSCGDEPTPDQSWWYTCISRSMFVAGYTAYGLLRLDNIRADHRYKVEVYKNDSKQWDWTADWNDVGSGWGHGFFWVTIESLTSGNWELRYYVDIGAGFPSAPVAKQVFSVSSTYLYTYDGNGYTCGDAPTPDGNWWYTCTNQSAFRSGDDIYGLVRIDDITANHQFRVDAYKNNTYQWDWSADWNYVGGGWDYAFFWPLLSDADPGDWEFRISVITTLGTSKIRVLYFRVE